jgi:hypothetical protein
MKNGVIELTDYELTQIEGGDWSWSGFTGALIGGAATGAASGAIVGGAGLGTVAGVVGGGAGYIAVESWNSIVNAYQNLPYNAHSLVFTGTIPS